MRTFLCALTALFVVQLHAQSLSVLTCVGEGSASDLRLSLDQLGGGHFLLRSSLTKEPLEMKRTSLSTFQGQSEDIMITLNHLKGSSFSLNIFDAAQPAGQAVLLQCQTRK
jgi:hypothetical protein